MGALTSTELHDVKARKTVGFNPEGGGKRFIENGDIFRHNTRSDFTEISSPVSWRRRQNFPPKFGKSTSGFAKSHPRRHNAGTLTTTVIYASQFLCKRVRDYTKWTPGPWRWMQQTPPKVGEFLSNCTISHSGRQNYSLSPAWRPQTSHTAINFADERSDFWPKCSSGSHAKKKIMRRIE